MTSARRQLTTTAFSPVAAKSAPAFIMAFAAVEFVPTAAISACGNAPFNSRTSRRPRPPPCPSTTRIIMCCKASVFSQNAACAALSVYRTGGALVKPPAPVKPSRFTPPKGKRSHRVRAAAAAQKISNPFLRRCVRRKKHFSLRSASQAGIASRGAERSETDSSQKDPALLR